MAGIQSSVIGFGCAPILGSVGHQQAERAINTALDVGVNHFDLARSYGYGHAEAMVGRMLRGRRDGVVLATKFGIQATLAARLLSPLKPLIRALRRPKARDKGAGTSPGNSAAQASSRMASLLHRRVPLEPATMLRSLEDSLRAMGTDRVEYLFVHAPAESIGRIHDLAETAERLKRHGKIRAWGLAAYSDGHSLHTPYLRLFDILQFDCSPSAPNYRDAVAKMGDKPNILFSPFRRGPQAAELSSPAATLKRLLADFPKSVVLCSMFNETHIRENASAVAGS